MSVKIGNAIRMCRMQKGMTQKELAYKAVLNQTTVCNIEKGREFPSKRSFNAIIRALGISEAHLFLSCLCPQDIKKEKLADFIRIKKELKDMLI